MKIFVTGITGFVGGAIANHFATLGHEVTGLGRKDSLPPHVSSDCNYIQADISKPLEPIGADIVIHAAGLASDTASFKDLHLINSQGTFNVVSASKEVKHFVHISSSSVYHFKDFPMEEMDAGKCYEKLSEYGKSKFLAEQHIQAARVNKKTILRPRAIYGIHDQSLLPRLLKLVKWNKLLLPQNLSKKISLTHIDNLIQAVKLCTDTQSKAMKIYNVADAEVYDLHNVLTILLPLAVGKPLQLVRIPAMIFNLFVALNNKLNLDRSFNLFAAASLTSTAVMSIEKIRHQMGYNPARNFSNSYPEIASWIHQEHGWKNIMDQPIYLNQIA
ncbi:MAG: NAD(P)-dependent oxidoreductase [Ginsengibacter sp.]